MMRRRFLVTGGAGYVGSHLVAALVDRGDDVTVIDSLRTGHRAAISTSAAFIEGDIADTALLDRVLGEGRWAAVFHFAARSLVGESMRVPMDYLIANGAVGLGLIDACVRHGIDRFVLSSTANVYGNPRSTPITEDAPLATTSPYGESKLLIERALRWAGEIHGLRYACLRYFNAAGADPTGRLGEDHRPETHLIPLAIDAALGRGPPLAVFGRYWPTADGTCIRDYVHVSDLAEAHLLALERLAGGSVTYNLGNGTGHSVCEVLSAVEAVGGRPVPRYDAPPRAGDPAVLVASSDLIRCETGWTPRHATLQDMVATAYAWREAHPAGYG